MLSFKGLYGFLTFSGESTYLWGWVVASLSTLLYKPCFPSTGKGLNSNTVPETLITLNPSDVYWTSSALCVSKMCRYLTKMSGLCHCRVPTDNTYGLDIKTSFCDNNSVLNGLIRRRIDVVEISFHFTRLQAVEDSTLNSMVTRYVSRYNSYDW